MVSALMHKEGIYNDFEIHPQWCIVLVADMILVAYGVGSSGSLSLGT